MNKKHNKESKLGVKFTLGTGNTYTLVSDKNINGQKIFEYRWHECPDSTFTFKSTRELDSIGLVEKITQYKIDNKIF